MIHGPCGKFNPNSPSKIDGKYSERYPRALISNTVAGTDDILYTEEGSKSATIKMQNHGLKVGNQWGVPYSPLLSKTYKAHVNVEYYNSVKSIKYICKYVSKGSNMTVFGMQQQETNDKNTVMHIAEIAQYQAVRYIRSNEAVWRILSFPIHKRSPTVVHLAVNLEKGQRVYLTANSPK
ncbi:uncharacterized protein LOC104236095 [Trichonephila clavipes]|nr:uncharacterized protein LOC104236095 [Trichonephila clavipes]